MNDCGFYMYEEKGRKTENISSGPKRKAHSFRRFAFWLISFARQAGTPQQLEANYCVPDTQVSTRGGHSQGSLRPQWFFNVTQNKLWRVVRRDLRFNVLIRED